MLINQKTMISPVVSCPPLFNRLKASVGLTKTISEEPWSFQTMSDDSCQDRCWLFLTDFIDFPKGGIPISSLWLEARLALSLGPLRLWLNVELLLKDILLWLVGNTFMWRPSK